MILVTGATGKVGQELVRRLSEARVEFRALVRSAGKAQAIREAGGEAVVGDLADAAAVEEALRGCREALRAHELASRSTGDRGAPRRRREGGGRVARRQAVDLRRGCRGAAALSEAPPRRRAPHRGLGPRVDVSAAELLHAELSRLRRRDPRPARPGLPGGRRPACGCGRPGRRRSRRSRPDRERTRGTRLRAHGPGGVLASTTWLGGSERSPAARCASWTSRRRRAGGP